MPQQNQDKATDHDTLTVLVQVMKNHVDNFRLHTDAFRAHEIQDQTNFDKLRVQTARIERVIWMATGAILSVEALPTILKLTHVLNK